MSKIINKIKELIIKYKSIILYLFFGVITMIINVGLYALLTETLKINEVLSNSIAWIITVIVVYITNKLYVFESKNFEKSALIKELISFIIARLGTLIIENIIIYVFIDLLEYNNILIKIISQVVVIVLNYVFSKLFIFKEKSSD